MVANMIVPRMTALNASAQPAAASRTTATGSAVAKPNAVIATPHNVAAMTMPTPCRRTCEIQPESSDARSAPIPGDAYSSPTTNPPALKRESASAGKSELGIPNTIAIVSMMKHPSTTRCFARYRNPAITDRSLSGSPPPTGTIDGSSQNAVSDARKPATPTA